MWIFLLWNIRDNKYIFIVSLQVFIKLTSLIPQDRILESAVEIKFVPTLKHAVGPAINLEIRLYQVDVLHGALKYFVNLFSRQRSARIQVEE